MAIVRSVSAVPLRVLHASTCALIMSLLVAASAQAAGIGATPAEAFRVPEGFQVDLLYEVPQEAQGSWVSMTVDPQGRLLVCDQYGGLYRITLGEGEQAVKVDPVKADIGMAQGLLFAFDSLYVNVNGRGGGRSGGVFRLQDQDGDDEYETVEHILPLNNGGEHGPHALILSPDKKQIYLCAGNNTMLPEKVPNSRVPRNWDEDHLLGRMPDARGHNANRLAPGGFVAKMNPDGSDFEVIATGFRNEYDIAFNQVGELFTYDADMEWDVGTPWYRPTRVNHVVSGAEFGWRNGTGKWPEYYVDSVGAAVNIGPGSPTGVCFGTGAKFPEKYQRALYVLDWSYGNIFAVHLEPDGSTYGGQFETFATAAPLPVTDIVVRPQDGHLYFTIGGRRTQSALYRIRYVGDEATTPVEPMLANQDLRSLRHDLEALHTPDAETEAAVTMAMTHLGHPDRQIRYAARIALEHQPVDAWRDELKQLQTPAAVVGGAVALARTGEASDQTQATDMLGELAFADLDVATQLDMLRAYQLVIMRLGEPTASQRNALVQKLDSHFPSGEDRLNRELAMMLVYLDAPGAVSRTVDQLVSGPSQEDQIHFAFVLRNQSEGWKDQDRQRYFKWFQDAAAARGGMSFGGFLENIRQKAIATLSEPQKQQLGKLLEKPKARDPMAELEPRKMVKQWKVDELADVVADDRFAYDFEKGKQMFAVAQCYKCHRMGTQGGILGPDLTGAGGRFTPKDLLTAIIEPNQSISDQYAATQFVTDSGEIVVGKIVNMAGDNFRVLTNMLDPSSLKAVNRNSIEEMQLSKNSMMPSGLLDSLTEAEIRHLMAYLRAGGNSEHTLFRQTTSTSRTEQ